MRKIADLIEALLPAKTLLNTPLKFAKFRMIFFIDPLPVRSKYIAKTKWPNHGLITFC